jgi:hypothetical protein
MPLDSLLKAGLKPEAQSRVTNGKDLLPGVDGRSAAMRRYRDVHAQLLADLATPPSEAQKHLVRRAATLSLWCEQAEADMANGKQIDIGQFTTAANALRRLLAGLSGRARPPKQTPAQYFQSRG